MNGDDVTKDLIKILEKHKLGVGNRLLFVVAKQARRLNEKGEFGEPEDMEEPDTNAKLKTEMFEIGQKHGLAIQELKDTDGLIEKLVALRELIYDNLLDQNGPDRDGLTESAKELVTKGNRYAGKSKTLIASGDYRNVLTGQDELIASAPAASYLSGALTGLTGSTERARSLEVVKTIASVLSALRIPTETGQARDDKGSGPFHRTNEKHQKLKPPGGGSAHDSFNRLRASVVRDVLLNFEVNSADDLYLAIESVVRAASAATANSLSMSSTASNYKQHPEESEERRELQAKFHEALKQISRLGEEDTEFQATDAVNARWNDRRATSPTRRNIRSRSRSRSESRSVSRSRSRSRSGSRSRSSSRSRSPGFSTKNFSRKNDKALKENQIIDEERKNRFQRNRKYGGDKRIARNISNAGALKLQQQRQEVLRQKEQDPNELDTEMQDAFLL